MNVPELLQEWQEGRWTITYDEGRLALPDISRATFYRMGARGEIPGTLHCGRKNLLSLPVYLEYLGVPRELIWPTDEPYCRECNGGAHE